jgi:hypothetical protein
MTTEESALGTTQGRLLIQKKKPIHQPPPWRRLTDPCFIRVNPWLNSSHPSFGPAEAGDESLPESKAGMQMKYPGPVSWGAG